MLENLQSEPIKFRFIGKFFSELRTPLKRFPPRHNGSRLKYLSFDFCLRNDFGTNKTRTVVQEINRIGNLLPKKLLRELLKCTREKISVVIALSRNCYTNLLSCSKRNCKIKSLRKNNNSISFLTSLLL